MVHCCVIGCNSRSERKSENVTFHTFPKDTRLRSWIDSSGRNNWTPGKNTRICSKHFNENSFRKTENKTYLNTSAIPTLHLPRLSATNKCGSGDVTSGSSTSSFVSTKDEGESFAKKRRMKSEEISISVPSTTKIGPKIQLSSQEAIASGSSMVHEPKKSSETIQIKPLTEEVFATPTTTPRKRKLIRKLNQKTILAESRKKKLAALRSKCRRVEKKNADLTAIIERLQNKNYINQEAADLLSSINAHETGFLKSRNSKFSPEVRKFALNLHFISPRAYNFVRKTYNTCLPHVRTLSRWYQGIEGEPGFSSESLEALKLLVKNSKSERKYICALSFDEMAIRKAVEWNGKNYVGFVNCGHQVDSDVLPVAKDALVFMLTCLNGSWKIPLGYFLIHGISAEQKASLVKTCIDLVSDCGLDIASLTFDGCAANLAMARLLGCNINDENINPVFTYKDKQIAIFPDPSHMLKLVRNTLGDKTYLRNGKDEVISWNYIQFLFELQEEEGFHLANKLRTAHINYRKQVMKVKLATQLFSESVADAIESCRQDLCLEQFYNSEATVEFIRKFNTLFDILNSRNLKAYGYKKPISAKNIEGVKDFLENTFQYIKSLKLGSDDILKTNRRTGFLGFMICIKSILFLYNELVQTEKIDFLSSYKLSQDHLEIFFSAIRAKGGFNNNPTATQFKSAFKRLLVHGELKHITTGNCVPLSDINILTFTRPEVAINSTTDRNRLIENEDILESLDNEVVVSKDHDYLADPTRLTEFARQVIIYIAGFVIKNLEQQIKCEQCLSSLRSAEKLRDTFLIRKDKGGLCHPSKHVIKLCEIAEEVYRKNKTLTKKDLLHHLLQKCLKECIGLRLFSDNNHFSDLNHYSLLIKAICKKYLNVRIHYATRSMNSKEDYVRNMYNKLVLFKGQ